MKDKPDIIFRERINYVIENGRYCGHAVNMPLVCEGATLEELKKRMLILAKMHIEFMQETMEMEEPFHFVEQENPFKK